MLTRELILAVAVSVVIASTLIALVVRGRARHCMSFVAYLCGILICDLLCILWPARYLTEDFWAVRQALHAVLRMAVALEITWRVVRSFPGALRVARVSALLLLTGSTILIAAAPQKRSNLDLVAWQPRVVACTALLFTLGALLVAWYHLPVRRLHRAIMGGFAVYSVFFATVLSILGRYGYGYREILSFVDVAAYLGVCTWWLVAAWASEEEAMPAVEDIRIAMEPASAKTVEKAA
jgi:hypothetical protein